MNDNHEKREQQAEAWRRGLAGQLAQRHDEEDRRDWWRTYVVVGVFILGCAVIGGCLVRGAAQDPGAPLAALEEGPPEFWATDGVGEDDRDAGAVPVIARPMPSKPFEGQKKPPCGKGQVTISGGCWEVLKRTPQNGSCGSGAFEHQGECHIPVKQAQRPPTSVEP